jgi:cystathionine gamma-synthase
MGGGAEGGKGESARFETLAARALGRCDKETGGVVPPIHVASTYLRDADNQYRSGYNYGRCDNATTRHAEAVISALEGARETLCFGSGMAAAACILLSLEAGDHVIAPRVMYWSLRNWMASELPRRGLEIDFVDMSDTQNVAAAMRPGKTRLVWAETPANPLWSLVDIERTAEIAHGAGALLAVDSTVATPLLTRPLELGADIVMHSASKYFNGHSDVIAGALSCARPDVFWQKIAAQRVALGAVLGPFEAAQLVRGLRTLHLRVRASCENALAIAGHFSGHPLVAEVLYPGLACHPQHDLAKRQMRGGFSGMLSIRVTGGEAVAIATAANVGIWTRATSLGGVESLIEHRASVEGAGSPVPADLLRLSAGVEHAGDLIGDLEQALEKAHG